MDIELFVRFFEWADNRLVTALQQVPEERFSEQSGNEWSLRKLLEHYVNSYDYLWMPLDQLKDRIVELSKMSNEELFQAWADSRSRFHETALKLEEEIWLPISKEKRVKLPRDEVFIAYSDHLTYHRGQLTRAIKQLGYEGVNTDYYAILAETFE